MSEKTYLIQTILEWEENDIIKLKEMCRKLEVKFIESIKIKYIKEKKSFEIKGANHKELRESCNYLIDILNSTTKEISRYSLVIPRNNAPKENINIITGEIGRPPPLEEEEEEITEFFGNNLEIVEEKKIKRDFFSSQISLIHYNSNKFFKLYFCHIMNHPYFNETVKDEFGEFYDDAHVLVTATFDRDKRKYKLPLGIYGHNLQKAQGPTHRLESIGKMIDDNNFINVKKALEEGLEHARGHKGEVRLYGSIGKVLFTDVSKDVQDKLHEFTNINDCAKSIFNAIATHDEELIKDFQGVLNLDKSITTSYYEIIADARNNKNEDFSEVCMHVNEYVGTTSTFKVTSKVNHLVNTNWTILDGKSDFSINLTSRDILQQDKKPYKTFFGMVSVNPTTESIVYENVWGHRKVRGSKNIRGYGNGWGYENVHENEDVWKLIDVKSIKHKKVTKFKLDESDELLKNIVVESACVKELYLNEQIGSEKIKATLRDDSDVKNTEGGFYYTLELYNVLHEKAFKQNAYIGYDETTKWTVDDILGENNAYLKKFVQFMKQLAEKCSERATEREEMLNQK